MGVAAAGVPSEHDPAHGIFTFDITLTHPFATKPQLSGFDVRGILITPGTFDIGPIVFADTDETRLLNADGYTRWWNPTEFTAPGLFGYTKGNLANAPASALTATINPYKYFADVLPAVSYLTPVYAIGLNDDGGRGVFTAGASNTRRYRIRFPMNPGPQVVYGYAVDASWSAPSPNPPTEIPDDFPINANIPEAFNVWVTPTANTLYYDSESGIGGGVFRLQVNVHDWQGMQSGNIHAETQVVRIFAPDLFPNYVDMPFTEETPIKAIYKTDLTGTATPTHSGEHIIAVRAVSQGGPNYDQGVAPAPPGGVDTWNELLLDIPDPECTADANNDWFDAVAIYSGGFVVDQLCSPTDYRDFYKFEFPPGYEARGELVLSCDLPSGKLEIYKDDQTLLTEAALSSGKAVIDLESLNIMPGKYYIRVFTNDNSFPAPYLLEFTETFEDVTPSSIVNITPDGWYVDPRYVTWKDDNLFLSGQGGFWTYDASDPSAPVLLNQEKFSVTSEPCWSGNFMYFLDDAGEDEMCVSMTDITDPESPDYHYSVISYPFNKVQACAMNSQNLYVITLINYPTANIFIYDWVSNPQSPVLVGAYNFTVDTPVCKMMLWDPEGDNTTLMVALYSGIYALYVEDPLSVVKKSHYPYYSINDFVINGNYLYFAGFQDSNTGLFFILGYVPSIGLGLLDSHVLNNKPKAIELSLPNAYITDIDNNYSVFDVSDPTDLYLVTTNPLPAVATDLKVKDDILCLVGSGIGFIMIDISDIFNPDILFEPVFATRGFFGGIFNDYLIVSEIYDESVSITTIDISDPFHPYVAAKFKPAIPLYGFMKFYPEEEIVLIGTVMYWGILDVSNPLSISILNSGSVSNMIGCLAKSGNFVYIGYEDKLAVYDISTNPPTLQNEITTPADKYWTIQNDDYLYISIPNAVLVISIQDPVNPLIVATYPTTNQSEANDIENQFLYLAESDRLEIVDISNPGSPSFVSFLPIPVNDPSNGFRYICVDSQFAYCTGDMTSTVCGLYPPENPYIVTTYDSGYAHRTCGLTLEKDGYLFEFGSPGGIQFYKVN
jgi:hypothetical protein